MEQKIDACCLLAVKKNLFLLLIILIAALNGLKAQVTQTLLGQVLDKATQQPLPGVVVQIAGLTPTKATVTDSGGYYKLEQIPAGRIDINFSLTGYQPAHLSKIYISGGKEVNINIELDEKTNDLKEVTVSGKSDKMRANNEIATVSARSFTVEETQKFAGSRNDVARMATNFAGVSAANDKVNDIVIRGNSPIGLLWRLEGIDIPNPNHFGDFGSTGGPVSMLNNNMLANSDFFTGAFPADYGNAYSGVFDLRMRNGNFNKHEFMASLGFNGVEAAAEGPFNKKKSKASYLINYRYSLLGILAKFGLKFGVLSGTGAAVPYYQDLSFKVNVPTNKAGTFTLFGVGGISKIDFLATEDNSNNFYSGNHQNLRNRVQTGIAGISHLISLNSSTFLKTIVAYTGNSYRVTIDSVSDDKQHITPQFGTGLSNQKASFHTFIQHRFNPKNVLKVGVIGNVLFFNILDSNRLADGHFYEGNKAHGQTFLLQPYINWQFRPFDGFTLNTGLHYVHLFYNNSWSLEPRIGMSYKFRNRHTISLGYGLHGQAAPLQYLLSRVRLNSGDYIRPNTGLSMMKSHQLVFGYECMISPTWKLKAEVYGQYILGAIGDRNGSSYSLLNKGSLDFATPDSLSNNIKAYNYGLETTLEKFLDKGFFLLFTGSLFQSKYQSPDGVWRNTRFNCNYILNALAGKEFQLTKNPNAKAKHVLSFSGKVTFAGGQHYSPLDLNASQEQGKSVYVQSQAFSQQLKPYFRADVKVAYILVSKKVSQSFNFDLQNISNTHNPLWVQYNSYSRQQETLYQLGFYPVIQYKVEF